jgi:hypothetical protein
VDERQVLKNHDSIKYKKLLAYKCREVENVTKY